TREHRNLVITLQRDGFDALKGGQMEADTSKRLLIAVILLSAPAIPQIQNQPDDGQWTMPAKNYASTRFSAIDQINTSNIATLKLAWSFSTGLTRGHEAA